MAATIQKKCTYQIGEQVLTNSTSTTSFCDPVLIGEAIKQGLCTFPAKQSEQIKVVFEKDKCECLLPIYYLNSFGVPDRFDVLCPEVVQTALNQQTYESCACSYSDVEARRKTRLGVYASTITKTFTVVTKELEGSKTLQNKIDDFILSSVKFMPHYDYDNVDGLIVKDSLRQVVLTGNSYTQLINQGSGRQKYRIVFELAFTTQASFPSAEIKNYIK